MGAGRAGVKAAWLPGHMHADSPYPPIAAHAVIGDLRTVAVVCVDGSIDWCCLPDLDGPSVFASLLDRRRGGRFRVHAEGAAAGAQRYEDDTNVLRTVFTTPRGRLALTDFMPLAGSITGTDERHAGGELHRLLECETGEVEVAVEWSPRFDYARAETCIEPCAGGARASGAGTRLALGGLPVPVAVDDDAGPVARARFTLRAGERVALRLRWDADRAPGDVDGCLRALEETRRAWRDWAKACAALPGAGEAGAIGRRRALLVRSGLTLKLLSHRHTGAIAAAATTSLPEAIGGVRNWDYRFSWIRDSAFTAQALFALGHRDEARDFLGFAQRAAFGAGQRGLRLQVMYGLHGETALHEVILAHLEGYAGSRPVRVGNAAVGQHQLDIYGELLSAAYELVRMGGTIDAARWRFLAAIADQVATIWREPDWGIWEVRGGPRQFVYSKVMAWVALDRAVRMAVRFGLPAPVRRWRRVKREIKRAVLTEGYDERLGAFVQAFGEQGLDAANLRIPVVEFLPFDDPRVQGTIDRTLERLVVNGLVYRYHTPDGLPGGEGAFGLVSFWMADALTLSGRVEEAQAFFDRIADRANHVGLFAEEFDPATGAFLGNLPQAFTHVGLVNSALYLAQAAGWRPPVPAPIGSREHRKETGHAPRASV